GGGGPGAGDGHRRGPAPQQRKALPVPRPADPGRHRSHGAAGPAGGRQGRTGGGTGRPAAGARTLKERNGDVAVTEKEERPLAVHRRELRAGYRDVDSMGVVYYGVYADWFTRGRIELMRSVGVRYADWERQGLFLPVLRLECRYRSSIA